MTPRPGLPGIAPQALPMTLQRPWPARQRPAWLCCALFLLACRVEAVDLELRVEDIGVRHHVGHAASVPLLVRVENPFSEAFRGELVAQLNWRFGPFEEDAVGQRLSRSLEVPPRGSRRVCLQVPGLARREPLLLQVVDTQGAVRAGLRFDWAEAGLAQSAGHILVGVLTTSGEDVQAIHEAVFFPRGATLDAVAPPRLKLLSLSPASLPPCLECYQELTFLIMAVPAGALTAEQERLLTRATLAGLHLVVVGRAPAGLLAEASAEAPVPRGRGSLQRIRSIRDPEAFARLRAAASDEMASARAALQPASPDDVFEPDPWLRGRFRQPELPGTFQLGSWLGLYVLLVGPGTFFWLRARGRREQAWLVMPIGGLLCTALLLAWVGTHKFQSLELDLARCVFSRDGMEEGRHSAHVRIASPDEGSYRLRMEGSWMPRETFRFGEEAPDVHWDESAVEFRKIRTPRWSATDFVTDGVARAMPPVRWEGDHIRNELSVAFAEAALLVGEDAFETRGLAPGAVWRFGEQRPSRRLVTLVRRWRLRDSAALVETIGFEDPDHVRRVMGSIRGLFLGVVERKPVELILEPRPTVERAWTLHVHVFEKGPS